MTQFVSGIVFLAHAVIALFFGRFWAKTHDRFFAFLSFAFALMAIERIPLAFMDPANETRPYIYVIRLVGFLIIIVAIIDKNREQAK